MAKTPNENAEQKRQCKRTFKRPTESLYNNIKWSVEPNYFFNHQGSLKHLFNFAPFTKKIFLAKAPKNKPRDTFGTERE